MAEVYQRGSSRRCFEGMVESSKMLRTSKCQVSKIKNDSTMFSTEKRNVIARKFETDKDISNFSDMDRYLSVWYLHAITCLEFVEQIVVSFLILVIIVI